MLPQSRPPPSDLHTPFVALRRSIQGTTCGIGSDPEFGERHRVLGEKRRRNVKTLSVWTNFFLPLELDA